MLGEAKTLWSSTPLQIKTIPNKIMESDSKALLFGVAIVFALLLLSSLVKRDGGRSSSQSDKDVRLMARRLQTEIESFGSEIELFSATLDSTNASDFEDQISEFSRQADSLADEAEEIPAEKTAEVLKSMKDDFDELELDVGTNPTYYYEQRNSTLDLILVELGNSAETAAGELDELAR